jgi:hypothetical protein
MLNKSLLLASIALCLSFSAAKAQLFSTGAITGDSSIEDVGTVVDAYAFNYGGTSFTINGVNFTSTSNINGTFSGYTANGPGIDGTGGGIVPSGSGGLDTNLSSNLQTLEQSGIHNASGNFYLELTGLNPGQTYALQLLIDANSHDARTQAYKDGLVTSATITAGGNQAGNPSVNSGDNTPYNPAYITDDFTATGATETLYAQDGGGAGAQLSGYVLEATPEPSTWALMGLGFVGLLYLVRRPLARS